MAKIKVTENELKNIIRESVDSVLNESINEKYLQVDLRNMPQPANANNAYYNLMSNPSDSQNGMNFVKGYNRADLYSKLENLGFTKDEIVRGLNASDPQVFRTRMNGTTKNITDTNRGQRKIDRSRRYSGKHGGPEASQVTARQIQELQQQVYAYEQENESLKTQNNQLSTQVNDLKNKLTAAQTETEKWKGSYTKLQTTNNELTKANQTLNAQMNNVNASRTRGAAAASLNKQPATPQVNTGGIRRPTQLGVTKA